MLSAALPGMLLSAAPGAMLAAVVALLVAVCVVLPSAPPLRHLLLRAALLRASGWQRRRLELQSTDVRHGQERRLRRLLPHGAAPGSDAFRERHPPSPCCSDGERAEPLPPLSLWAVLRSCWSAEPALQGVLLYLHALHRTFPRALTLRGTALLGWAPSAPHAPGFCPLPTLYCTPPEAAALPLRSAALRVQLLFALRTRSLRVLEARLPNELHDVLVALRDGWAELAHDLELGTLSPQPGLPEEMRGWLQALLVPDSTRAAELRAECERGFEGIVRRLWPQLQVVVVGTVRGGERLYCDALPWAACEGLPLYCPWYRVAGALLGVNLWPKEPTPRFVLCPEWAFCEFLPCPVDEKEEQHTALLGELWEGREYTLILTARPGEYRCRAGEVLRVAGFHKQCPVVEPVRRESQVLSVRGESIPEEQFCRSLRRALGMWPGARLMDYICVESTLLGASSGAGAPHYEVFVELRGLRDLSEEQRHKLDHCLQEDFPIYKSFRFKGSIGPLRLHLVGAGAFARLRAAMGCPVPMPRVLREERLLAVIQGTVIS
ncbi:GH3 domain-containing protein [Gallus gallus]|uniref:GH3 domain-containing protein n=1 Tax=Gallus gallus TaxID=9031 RepID=UPI001AEA73BD|nr:GH3 domain-containing protein [Gallus gallus]